MNAETRACQNCKNEFIIRPDDFSFYLKMGVPVPTMCPECRMVRRLLWRNHRSLYKRSCMICAKTLFSMYSDEATPVVCMTCWNSDKWDPYANAKDYDFSVPFFVQLKALFKKQPRPFAYRFGNNVNSDFANYIIDDKDVYLSYSIIKGENIMYSDGVDKSKNTVDCFASRKMEGCYGSVDSETCYNSRYAIQSQNCLDCKFIYDCVNCQNCCLSSNLRNKSYYFKNQKMTKEEYETAVAELELDTYSGSEKAKKNLLDIMKNYSIHRYAQIFQCQNVIGDFMVSAKNVFRSYDVYASEEVSYSQRVVSGSKEIYDCNGIGTGELIYECAATSWGTFRDIACYIVLESKECEYSMLLNNCTNCFGCVGLSHTKYAIFNKKYEKEEYEELVPKIKQHMKDMPYVDAKGRVFSYGEFFPYDMSPFGYNETQNQDYFRINKEKAIEMDYPWKDREPRNYTTTKLANELPESINDVDDTILNEIIACPNNGNIDFQCTSAYRIIGDELEFYRKHNLPLPRACPNCRHYERMNYRNALRLYTRQCMQDGCQNTFETTYSPNGPEVIFCASCYQQEVI